MTGWDVLELVVDGKGGQALCATENLLIKGIVVEGVGWSVLVIVASLYIFVAQLLHIIEAVGDELEGFAVRVGLDGCGGECELAACRSVKTGDPDFLDGVIGLDGVDDGNTPLADFGHDLDGCFEESGRDAGGCGLRRWGVCGGRSGEGEGDLSVLKTKRAVGEAREGLDIDVGFAVNLHDWSLSGVAGDDERAGLLGRLCGKSERR